MSKASQQHIADNELVIARGKDPAIIKAAQENIDLWLSVEGKPGRFGTAFAAARGPNAPETPVAPPAAPKPTTPRGQGAQADEGEGANARTGARIRRIVEDTGVSRAEAQRRMALADGSLDVEDMTAAELRVHLADNYAGIMSSTPEDEPDERTREQVLDDLQAGKDAEQAAAEESREWADGLYDRMDATRNLKALEAQAERTRDATIAALRRDFPHLSADEAAKYAPSLDQLVGIAATQPRTAVQQATDDVLAAWAAEHPEAQ